MFISYAVEDRETADVICELLESSGWRCWIAPRDILPGSDWGESIIDAINQSQLMIFIYSVHAGRSLQIKREIERASSKGVTIVPFRIEEVPVSKSLEYYVSNAYWIDALSAPLEPHLQLLREMVERLVDTPPTDAASQGGRSRETSTRPNVAMKSDFKRRRRFWPRSRKAAIAVIASGVALLLAVTYFGLRYWRTTAGSFEAHLNQSQMYRANGELDRAIEELNQAIRVAPDNWLGYRARGETYYTRGYTRSITSDYSLAVPDLKRAIELNSTDELAWQVLGQTYIMMRAWEDAQVALTASLKINLRNVESLKARAYVYQQLREYNTAIIDLGEAVKLAPNDVQVLGGLGDAYLYKGDYSHAADWFTEAIRLFPDNAALRLRRSEAYAGLGKVDEAEADKLKAQRR